MQFLREYAVNIVIVSILAVIFEIILPSKSYKKYISVIIGLIVMMVIISPIKGLFGSDFETFALPWGDYAEYDMSTNTNMLVSTEFKRRLEEEITKKVEIELNVKCNCKVTLSVNEKGEIMEIGEVEISPCNSDIINFISKNYGIEEEKIGGDKLGGN